MSADARDVAVEVETLIGEFGDDAYYAAVRKAVRAADDGIQWAAEIYADTAKELLKMGYHNRGPNAKAKPQ